MLNCTVTLMANAGIVLNLCGHSLWIDALHTDRVPGFSTVSPALWAQARTLLPPPELLFFTHCHPDHYARSLTNEARILWPAANLILPQREFPDQLLLSGHEARLSAGGMTLRFLRLPHEGGAEIPHYGLLLSGGGGSILVAGDCEPASPVLARYLEGVSVDLAVLNFPWLTLRRGRRYLEEVLRPRHLLLVHLPFPEDDANGYLDVARRAAEASSLADVRLLYRPLQQEAI